MRTFTFALAVSLIITAQIAFAEPPSRPFSSFESAKNVARNGIYLDHPVDLYCGCAYTPNKTKSGGVIDASSCGYKPRKNKKRGKVLEWEHIVPAAYFGSNLTCWKTGNKKCVRPAGKLLKGRECCSKVNPSFKRIEADLHNLAPAVGELNGDRSNLPYGIVFGEPRRYGSCDFAIGGKPKVTEPRPAIRGDVARVWLYMADTYNLKITAQQKAMFQQWSKDDPVDDRERARDRRIEGAQGNRNPFVN